jgi:streptomycin 6-kinase
MNIDLPEDFQRRIVDVHGESGAHWLQTLPVQLQSIQDRWNIKVHPPYPLSYNYVAPVEGPGSEAWAIKLCVPNPELTGEILALRLFNGEGAVKLIHGDPQEGVMLIERLQPGTPLHAVQDDLLATRTSAMVMQRLWRAAPQAPGLRTVADLGQGLVRLRQKFDGGCGPFPQDLVELAEAQLIRANEEVLPLYLLHGDLHHDNILFDERRGWLAIDPTGILGNPGYEVGSLLFNPLPDFPSLADMPRLLFQRLDTLSHELRMPVPHLEHWGIFKCVLSAWWDYEDHGQGWEPVIAVARALADR